MKIKKKKLTTDRQTQTWSNQLWHFWNSFLEKVPCICTVWSSFWLEVPLICQQIHVRFMALSLHLDGNPEHGSPNSFMILSWQIHGAFLALPPLWPGGKVRWKCHESAKPTWNLHVRFIADSSRTHGTFYPNKLKSCQIHCTFMAVSWRCHIQAWPGYSLPTSIAKRVQKIGFSCRFVLFAWFQSYFFIMSDSCRFHGTFMALLHPDFCLFFHEQDPHQQLDSSQNDHLSWMSDSSRIHEYDLYLGKCDESAMNLSWKCHEHGMKCLEPCFQGAVKMPWYDMKIIYLRKCHESAMNLRWKCHENGMKCLEPCFQGAVKMPWNDMKIIYLRKCHESAMNLPWKCHENAMKFLEPCFQGCRQSALKVPWKWFEYGMNMIQLISTIFDGRFIALSTFIQKQLQAVLMHRTFSKKLFQNCHNWFDHVCVCLFVLSVFFSSFDIIFIDGLSSSRWPFFCLRFFFDQNKGL